MFNRKKKDKGISYPGPGLKILLKAAEFSEGNSFEQYGKNAVIISPNIGKPKIISITSDEADGGLETFKVQLLFIADNEIDTAALLSILPEQIELKPIIGFDRNEGVGIRGKGIKGKVITILRAPLYSLGDERIVNDFLEESPRETPLIEKVYAGKSKFILCVMEFGINAEIMGVLKRKGYIMFDIEQRFFNNVGDEGKGKDLKINYHAVVIKAQDWKEFTIVHATDLHIAKRNDEILPILLKRYDRSISKALLGAYDFITNNKEGNLIERFNNPNNNLRLFIKIINEWAEKNWVDFVVFSGDLIDFCIRSDGGDKINSFDLPNTNWATFLNILLNKPLILRPDIEPVYILPSQEIMVPIFTLLGNHDYRAYHYDFKWPPLYKFLNLRPLEIMHYNDVIPANPISSLVVNRKTLVGYNQYINPYQNYYIKLGDHLLIMMDSGSDSAKETKDLLMGDPSSIGFSDDQYKFMENILKKHRDGNKGRKNEGMNLVFFHAPVLNPFPISKMNKKIKEEYAKFGLNSWKDFNEYNLKKLTNSDPRADFYLNFKYGTISQNWKESLDLFNQYKCFIFNGHTHYSFEARTRKVSPGEESEIVNTRFLVVKEKIRLPVAIYIDEYSKKADKPSQIKNLLPIYVQTAALGVNKHLEKGLYGAFRIIHFKNNAIASFKEDYLSNYVYLNFV
ncbi:MAG: metallophosphoesterase [Promethearchaeota archaeon]